MWHGAGDEERGVGVGRVVAFERCEAEQHRSAHCPGRKSSICDVFGEEHLSLLMAEAEPIQLPAKRVFIEEGAPADNFYVVKQGQIRLFKLLPDGRRQIISFAGSGVFLGLAAMERYAFSAEVLEEASLCRFSRAGIGRLASTFPLLEHRLREEASRELVRMQGRILLLGRKTARERVATFLLEYGDPSQGFCLAGQDCVGQILQFSFSVSRGDIADYLGLTIETVSRTISLFKREKIIAVAGVNTVTLLDEGRLKAIAEGGELRSSF